MFHTTVRQQLAVLISCVGVFSILSLSLPVSTNATTTVAGPFAHVQNAGEIALLPDNQLLVTDIGNLDRTGSQVLITDFNDRLIWRYTGALDIPHSAYPMSNGDILIADTGNNRVIEVNRESEIVWNSDDLGRGGGRLGQGTLSDGTKLDYPNDAKPLPNGDLLISLRLQNRVVEITPTGHIVKKISGFLHRQHNPNPLSNGNTLIADSDANRVIEVGVLGKHIIWKFGAQSGPTALAWPRDAERLKNGDTLITDSNNDRLLEVTHSRRIVRQWTGIQHPYSTAVLPDGNILVGDGSQYGVVELNNSRHMVWFLNQHNTSGPSKLSPTVRNGGFEHGITGSPNLPTVWQRNDALAYSLTPGKRVDMVRDCHVRHKGHCSGRISYKGDSNGIFFGQLIHVTAGARYRFSGWIKTQNVRTCYPCSYGENDIRGHTAEYELQLYEQNGGSALAPQLRTHSGTSGWLHDVVYFTVPKNVHVLGIHAELRGQGTVWFDDVWVQKLT